MDLMPANQAVAKAGWCLGLGGGGFAETNRHPQLRMISKKASKADVGRVRVDLVSMSGCLASGSHPGRGVELIL